MSDKLNDLYNRIQAFDNYNKDKAYLLLRHSEIITELGYSIDIESEISELENELIRAENDQK